MVVETKNERQENTIAMNPPRCDAVDYIHFLIAAQRVFTCTEAARCQPTGENAPAHDLMPLRASCMQRQPSDTEALWREAEGLVDKRTGFLVLDDSHHLRQALCQEDGFGDLSLEREAPEGRQGH